MTVENENAKETESSDAAKEEMTMLRLTKNDLARISEDPYFQYLVGSKARTQTWAFLSIIGSAILAVILYGGWEFKSAKETIDRNVKAVSDETAKIQKNDMEVETATRTAQEQLKSTETLLAGAQVRQLQSEQQTRELINSMQGQVNTSLTAAQGQMNAFSSAQKNFLDSQRELLDKTFTANKEAAANAFNIAEKASTITTQLENVKTAAQTTKDEADLYRQFADAKIKEINGKLKNVTSLQTLNWQLAKSEAAQLVSLGDRQSTEIWVHEIGKPGDDINKLPRYRISFRVGDMHKTFSLYYKVEREDEIRDDDPSQVWQQWHINRSPRSFKELQRRRLDPAPFEAILVQKYSGFFAPEFIVMRIVPVTKEDNTADY